MVAPAGTVRIDLGNRAAWVGHPEVMDRPDVGGPSLDRALLELGIVHRWFGGARTLRRGLAHLESRLPETFSVLDVGCGGGEVAGDLSAWCRARGRAARVVLTDFNRDACRRARANTGDQVYVLQSDVESISFPTRSVDVVHCGLVLHHFETRRAARILADLHALARVGLLVSDLHRHWLPYVATRVGSRCLSRSPMVRHDAPLSVARGFRRPEWADLATAAGFAWTHVDRVWPYRWLAVKAVDP